MVVRVKTGEGVLLVCLTRVVPLDSFCVLSPVFQWPLSRCRLSQPVTCIYLPGLVAAVLWLRITLYAAMRRPGKLCSWCLATSCIRRWISLATMIGVYGARCLQLDTWYCLVVVIVYCARQVWHMLLCCAAPRGCESIMEASWSLLFTWWERRSCWLHS
jgi:hypothetical protein